MKPTDKDPAIDELIASVMGKGRKETIRSLKCMTCDNDVTGFRDALSEKEYTISGMCQACQDSVFGE